MQIKRRLVISDIHGCYDEFIRLLGKVFYNHKEDQLILLGDYCDRGKNSKKVIELIKYLNEECGAIVLKGNHDQMFVESILEDDDSNFLLNGGLQK
ncbi:metallophosphoesterase [Paenibacillus radicibacter]|uniref:metallophosphoesterase n=1 Tax=Paenibacillus radicibacter TaxID=2972488 RepID=UPI00280B58EA|nr:metallophosphoesterase [Paenibacillus radicibacter]